jgi:hypothetical protein
MTAISQVIHKFKYKKVLTNSRNDFSPLKRNDFEPNTMDKFKVSPSTITENMKSKKRASTATKKTVETKQQTRLPSQFEYVVENIIERNTEVEDCYL